MSFNKKDPAKNTLEGPYSFIENKRFNKNFPLVEKSIKKAPIKGFPSMEAVNRNFLKIPLYCPLHIDWD
jgi:hypothetical protein